MSSPTFMRATRHRLQQEGCGDDRPQCIEAQPVFSGRLLGAQDAADAMIDHAPMGVSRCRPSAMCVIAAQPVTAPSRDRGVDVLFAAPRRHLGLCPSKAVAARICKKSMMCWGIKRRPKEDPAGAGVRPPHETKSSQTGPSAEERSVNLIRSFGPLLLQPSNDPHASDI